MPSVNARKAEAFGHVPMRHALWVWLLLASYLVPSATGGWLAHASQAARQANSSATNAQVVFRRVSHSVFVVVALDERGKAVALGSGVAISATEVVTNRHVLSKGSDLSDEQGSRSWPVAASRCSEHHDLCLLKVEGLSAVPIPIHFSKTLAVGERVYAIGAQEGLERNG